MIKWKRVACVMFTGEYNHTIDIKGRIIVPAKFRSELGSEFVITVGLDGCLFIYPQKEFDELATKLAQLPGTAQARKLQRYIMSSAACVEVDKQGRILIPSVLREFSELQKDVVLIGVGSRVEIWSKERWEGTASYEDMDEIAEHMEELGLGI